MRNKRRKSKKNKSQATRAQNKNRLLWVRRIVKGFFLLVVLALALGYGGYLLYNADIFKVEQIKSNIDLDPSLKRMILGKPLLSLNTQRIHSRIMGNRPEYKETFVFKEFPSCLRIEVQKRKPIAQIKRERFYVLDKEGIIIAEGKFTPRAGLVIVELGSYVYPLSKGARISSPDLTRAFDLIAELDKKKFPRKFPVKSINVISSSSLHFIIEVAASSPAAGARSIKVILGPKDFARKLDRLEFILLQKSIKEKLTSLKYIDLRYEKVYLGPQS